MEKIGIPAKAEPLLHAQCLQYLTRHEATKFAFLPGIFETVRDFDMQSDLAAKKSALAEALTKK